MNEDLEYLKKLYEIKRLESEIICWKIFIIENDLVDEDKKTYEKSIEENHKKLSVLR